MHRWPNATVITNVATKWAEFQRLVTEAADAGAAQEQ